MDNPFKKRASEYFEDPAAFLSLVSAEPVRAFFSDDYEQLFDRSVTIAGTPGSGKTTIAKLLEFDTLVALATVANNGENRSLAAELTHFNLLCNNVPTILAFRLPVGSTLREIWELPYSTQIRSVILRSFIQARAILGWLRKLEKAEVEPTMIHVQTRDHHESIRELIKADDIGLFKELARKVEASIFKVVTALIPPAEENLVNAGLVTYQAFDALEAFIIDGIPAISGIPGVSSERMRLKPLLILDDAHELHPEQFADVETWLRQRELKIGRWLMTRVDAIKPEDLRSVVGNNDQAVVAGTISGRDRVFKLMQGERRDKKAFRKIARDISKRYIEQMPTLRRHVSRLEETLDSKDSPISATDQKNLLTEVKSLRKKTGLSDLAYAALDESIPKGLPLDQHLAVLRILLNRELRKPIQNDLFSVNANHEIFQDADEDQPEVDEENITPLKKRAADLLAGAKLQLHHEFKRPYYYGFDVVADASSDNIEQFINLAGALVDVIETKLLRGNKPILDAKLQHDTLTHRAQKVVTEWDFPHSIEVKRMVRFVASKCKEKTLLPNAPLSAGANAFGVPQSEIEALHKTGGARARILHFALAYNAFSIREGYRCKKKLWCLFTLGGLPILANGLTLGIGGFCEGHLSDLFEYLE